MQSVAPFVSQPSEKGLLQKGWWRAIGCELPLPALPPSPFPFPQCCPHLAGWSRAFLARRRL